MDTPLLLLALCVGPESKANALRFVTLHGLMPMGAMKMIQEDGMFLIPLVGQEEEIIGSLLRDASPSFDYTLIMKEEHLFIKTQKKKGKERHPRQLVIDLLKNDDHWLRSCSYEESEWISYIPTNWIVYGDILVLKQYRSEKFEGNCEENRLGWAFASILHVRCVLGFSAGITGELRTPEKSAIHFLHNEKRNNKVELLSNLKQKLLDTTNPSETIHKENGIEFCFDVARVMFCPGNGTERLRARHYADSFPVTAGKDHIILDMFAGIGYFSVPMAIGNAYSKLICIEKNPTSAAYLEKNLMLNGVEPEKYQIYCGDNRLVGEEWLGRVHRISLGYLPETFPFLCRAFSFLEVDIVCFLHYHYLYDNDKAKETAAEHLGNAVEEFAHLHASLTLSYSIVSIVTVKPYGPNIYHGVANIQVIKKHREL